MVQDEMEEGQMYAKYKQLFQRAPRIWSQQDKSALEEFKILKKKKGHSKAMVFRYALYRYLELQPCEL